MCSARLHEQPQSTVKGIIRRVKSTSRQAALTLIFVSVCLFTSNEGLGRRIAPDRQVDGIFECTRSEDVHPTRFNIWSLHVKDTLPFGFPLEQLEEIVDVSSYMLLKRDRDFPRNETSDKGRRLVSSN